MEKQEFMPPLSPDDVTLVRVPVPMEMPLNDTSLDETLRRIPAIQRNPTNAASPTSSSTAIFRSAFIQTITKLYGYATTLIVIALTARMLQTSPNDPQYGNYSTIFIYLAFFTIIADSGILLISIREAAKAPQNIEKILGATLTLKVLLCFIAYGGAILIVPAFPYQTDVRIGIIAVGISMILSTGTGTFDVVFATRLQVQYPAAAELASRNIIFIGTGILFVYSQFHPVNETTIFYLIIALNVTMNIFNALIRWIGIQKQVKVRFDFEIPYLRHLLAISAPLGVVLILQQIHYKVDGLLLSFLRTPVDVGIYNMAYKSIDVVILLFIQFASIVFPVLSRQSTEGETVYRRSMQRMLNISITIALPITMEIILFAPEIIRILGQGRFALSVLPLQFLAGSVIFSFMNTLYSNSLVIRNHLRPLMVVQSINIIANVALNWYAIPRFSYNGSAVATIITEGLGMLLVAIVTNRLYSGTLPQLRVFVSVLLASGALALTVKVLQLFHPLTTLVGSGIIVAISVLVYVSIMLGLRAVDPALITEVRRRIRGRSR